jgi:hypothetical protein
LRSTLGTHLAQSFHCGRRHGVQAEVVLAAKFASLAHGLGKQKSGARGGWLPLQSRRPRSKTFPRRDAEGAVEPSCGDFDIRDLTKGA